MLELGISQAQSQFTKLLSRTVVIVDKKSHLKKAVIMPYSEYRKLLALSSSKKNDASGTFDKFIGILDNDFSSDDTKYNEIIK